MPYRYAARMIAALLAALLACAAAAGLAAAAWSYDGAELARFAADYEALRDAGGSTDDAHLAARVAYFHGFVNGVARVNSDKGWFCVPDSTSMGDTWDAVAKFLRDYPDLLGRPPTTLVIGALGRSFPCPKAPPPPPTKPAPDPKPKAKARPAQ